MSNSPYEMKEGKAKTIRLDCPMCGNRTLYTFNCLQPWNKYEAAEGWAVTCYNVGCRHVIKTFGFEEELRDLCQREINNEAARLAIAKGANPVFPPSSDFSKSQHNPAEYLRHDELRDLGLAPQIT